MKEDFPEARNRIAFATSFGSPTRFIGTPATRPAFLSAVPVKRFSIPVLTGPGATRVEVLAAVTIAKEKGGRLCHRFLFGIPKKPSTARRKFRPLSCQVHAASGLPEKVQRKGLAMVSLK